MGSQASSGDVPVLRWMVRDPKLTNRISTFAPTMEQSNGMHDLSGPS